MNGTTRTAAIYTTYHPDNSFRARIDSVVAICDTVIVVDNTPGGYGFTPDQTYGLIILQDGNNKGLGAALNIGLTQARRLGCERVVLFDQDSSPAPAFLTALFAGLDAAGPRVLVGPTLVDDAALTPVPAPPASVNQADLVWCTSLATSGMCFDLTELPQDAEFTEDYFLDFVDFDWCWQLAMRGWKVCKIGTLAMPHRLGEAQRSFLGLTYHIPAPFRHYFQFRDSLKLAFRKGTPAYSRFRLLLILPPKFLIYPFLLDRGVERLSWMVAGLRDALLGITGPGAAADKLKAAPLIQIRAESRK